MYREVETQFLLFGLILHTQPLNSSEQHTRADLEFSSDFALILDKLVNIEENMNIFFKKLTKYWIKEIAVCH